MASHRMLVFVMGGFRLDCGCQTVPDLVFRRRSTKSLLKILATDPTHRMHREQLYDLFWPDLRPEAAQNNLRRAIYHARQAMSAAGSGCGSVLRVADEMVLLEDTDAVKVWIDADRFEAMADKTLSQNRPDLMEEALALYSGDLLPEDRYADWASCGGTTSLTSAFGC